MSNGIYTWDDLKREFSGSALYAMDIVDMYNIQRTRCTTDPCWCKGETHILDKGWGI